MKKILFVCHGNICRSTIRRASAICCLRMLVRRVRWLILGIPVIILLSLLCVLGFNVWSGFQPLRLGLGYLHQGGQYRQGYGLPDLRAVLCHVDLAAYRTRYFCQRVLCAVLQQIKVKETPGRNHLICGFGPAFCVIIFVVLSHRKRLALCGGTVTLR